MKILCIICCSLMLALCARGQTFTPIHNAQAPDYISVVKYFGIPYGPTPALNSTRTIPGAQFFNTSDNSLYMWDGTQWTKVSSSVITSFFTYTLPGGYLIYDSLLSFHTTPARYYILGRYFTAPRTYFTLDPAPGADRIDKIYGDTLGNIGVLKGVDNGGEPLVNPSSQIELGKVVLHAGDIVPPYIYNTTIYKENGPWTGTSDVAGANFAYTTNPHNTTYSTYLPSFTNGQYVNWLGSSYTIEGYDFITLWLRLNSALTGTINFTLMDGAAAASNTVILSNGQFGLNTATVNSYQEIVIPLNYFTLYRAQVDNLQVGLGGTNAGSLQIDNVQLQYGGAASTASGGVITYNGRDRHVTSRRTDNLWAYDSSGLNADSTYDYHFVNGILRDSLWKGLKRLYSDTCHRYVDTVIAGRAAIYQYDNPYCIGGGGGSGSGIFAVYAGSGLQKVNDSTLRLADSVRTNIYSSLATKLTANQAITVTATGDATGVSSSSGTAPSLPLTLATVNSNVGSFTNASVTVNAKGLVTAVSSGAGGGVTADSTQTYVATPVFNWPSVPSSYNDFKIYRNNMLLNHVTDFTKSGDNITVLLYDLVAGDRIRYIRLK